MATHKTGDNEMQKERIMVDQEPLNLGELSTATDPDQVIDDPEVLFLNQVLEDHPDIKEDTPVVDLDKANSILYVIGQIKDEMDGISEVANKQIDRAKMFEERELGKRQRTVDFLTSRLFMYATATGKRTVSLPNGKLKLIKRQERLEYVDIDKVLAWIKTNDRSGEMIRIKEELNKTKIKMFFKNTGEIPDGVEIIQQEDSFKVVPE